MDISTLLKAVIFNIRARDHEAVIKELAAGLVPGEALGKVVSAVKDHESVKGVLSGTNSAVFHCLSEDVKDTLAAVGVSKKGVRRRGKRIPERIFFLVISPIKESGSHLQVLSKIEWLLLDRTFHHAVLAAKSAEEVVREIRKAEGTARSLYIPLQKEEVFTELDTSDRFTYRFKKKRSLPNSTPRAKDLPHRKPPEGSLSPAPTPSSALKKACSSRTSSTTSFSTSLPCFSGPEGRCRLSPGCRNSVGPYSSS